MSENPRKPVGPWRSPQLLRDLKPPRPGVPEVVVEVDRDTSIPLLIAKCHNELFEMGEEFSDLSEHADVLATFKSLGKAVCAHLDGPYRQEDVFERTLDGVLGDVHGELQVIRTSLDARLGSLHRALELFARDLTSWNAYRRLLTLHVSIMISALIDIESVLARMAEKEARLGGFDARLLWASTEFPA